MAVASYLRVIQCGTLRPLSSRRLCERRQQYARCKRHPSKCTHTEKHAYVYRLCGLAPTQFGHPCGVAMGTESSKCQQNAHNKRHNNQSCAQTHSQCCDTKIKRIVLHQTCQQRTHSSQQIINKDVSTNSKQFGRDHYDLLAQLPINVCFLVPLLSLYVFFNIFNLLLSLTLVRYKYCLR